MSITNPFEIEFGGMSFGGDSSTYQLIGPYVIDRGYESLRLVFDVLVVGTSIEELQTLSAAIESRFSTRLQPDDTLVITMGANSWTFNYGTDILDPKSSISKSGNPDTDRAYSRAYTCVVDAQMPDQASGTGLRELEVIVTINASRQKTVTLRGIYTSNESGSAKANYDSGADALSSSYTSAVDGSATWELVDESYTYDRERVSGDPKSHFVSFSRQYVELLADQTNGQRDDNTIKDHRITFTDLSQYPGDSIEEGVGRLRRVVGSYDCAVNVEQSQNLRSVYRNKVQDHLKQLFEDNFNPSQFAIEEQRVSYDETANRISVSFQFVYQSESSEAIVEVQQSLAYRESRQIDYTYTHGDDEFAADADVGFASLERIWSRTVKAIGSAPPTKRISERAASNGVVGRWEDPIFSEAGPDSEDTTKIKDDGWNVVASTSQATPVWIGAPDGDRMQITILSETVVERFHRRPADGGGGGGPITGQ